MQLSRELRVVDNEVPEFFEGGWHRREPLDAFSLLQEIPQPVVHVGIDDEMDPILVTAVDDAVRLADVDEVAVSSFEPQPFAREIELHAGTRLNRNMNADVAVVRPEPGIAVLANDRPGCQAQEPHRFQWTAEPRQHAAKIRTAVLQ